MGKQLVDALRSRGEVVTVNRGNSYWGSCSSPTLRANRRHREKYRDSISELVNSGRQRRWLGVVDFCGYSPKDMQESLPDILFDWEIFPIYIFISTDSVYEVSPNASGESSLGRPVTEDCAGLQDPSLYNRDAYGHKKLMGEEALSQRSELKQSLVILRLPDVLGEYDDTLRLWSLKLWVESGMPVYSPTDLDDTPLAFVYSGDVVAVITDLLMPKAKTVRGCFNLCSDEQIDFTDLIRMIASTDQVDASVPRITDKGVRKQFLPSVEFRRRPLSNEKGKKSLKFNPTPLQAVLERSVSWINKVAEKEFRDEFSEAIRDLPPLVRERWCELHDHVVSSSSSGDGSV